ncbi:MAG: tetraacyldisaccharide 4'-kinase [Chitinophagaceae bacterium]|nr:MAG: tetraacyldisaccharide 4'-kinase [Chitinophagaceae bacterium]
MNFNNLFLKSFRVLLLPFAVLYGWVVTLRNWLFQKHYLKSVKFNVPMICVGNLSLGGTGKSPMVEYLLSILSDNYKVATLSRGYKRKTEGYALATANTTALEIGDEPKQFHLKFPNVSVAVCERRIEAIPQLIQDVPSLQLVILDDAFQHREIVADYNILLTEYDNLYCDDFFIPTGDLRDERRSAKRANIIVVTKCPTNLTITERDEIIERLYPEAHQEVFFTSIAYETPYHIYDPNEQWVLTLRDEVLLVCGIANPLPLKNYLHENTHTYYQLSYSDHHIFSIEDLQEIKQKFEEINSKSKLILTTEKDAVRLVKYTEELNAIPLYVLPIKPSFLFGAQEKFNQLVLDNVAQFYKNNNGN